MKTKYMVILPIIIAIIILVALVKAKEEPRKNKIKNIVPVKIETLEKRDIDIAISSFGTVLPKNDLPIISAVKGDVLYVHPKLKNGNFIKKDEVLLRIDDKEYALNVKDLEIKIKELKRELISSKKLLKIEQEKLLLDKKELRKYENLKDQVSDSKLSHYKNIVLRTKNSVENYLLKLEVLPQKIKSLELKKEIAMIALNDCIITMPFDGIIYDVSVEQNQYILKGKNILRVYEKDVMEIKLNLSLAEFSKIKDLENLKASFYSSSIKQKISGDFSRISEGIDEKTRTIELIFDINEPVLKGVFLEALIEATKLKDVIVIPRNSFHKGNVYLEEDGKLKVKQVSVLYENDQFYIIKGLIVGDNLIVSSIIPAVEGMDIKGIK